MRRSLALILAFSLLLGIPARSQAKVRVGWLITAIGTTVAAAGCAAGAVVFHVGAGVLRSDAERNSSPTYSYNYPYARNGRYYSANGDMDLQLAPLYSTLGWVYTGAAVATGVVALIAWPKVKAPARVATPAAAALLDLQDGQWTFHAPVLSFQPLIQGYALELLHAEF